MTPMQNKPQLSAELADGIMEIINRHGENTLEGGIYWNKQLGWNKKGSTAYNAEEECRKEVQQYLATALGEQKKAINDEWLYQKANDHDARIRADERKAVLAEVEGWIKEVQYDGMIDAEIMIQWIQTMKGKK